jgi:hypothetical protein
MADSARLGNSQRYLRKVAAPAARRFGHGTRMFDRFIRLAKARKALQERRFEDALQLAADPLIMGDRRAEDVRTAARGHVLERARKRLAAGDLDAARQDLGRLKAGAGKAGGGDAELLGFLQSIEAAHAAEQAAVDLARKNCEEARRLFSQGELGAAEAVLGSTEPAHLRTERAQLRQRIEEARRLSTEHLVQVRSLLDQGDVEAAIDRFKRAVALDCEVVTGAASGAMSGARVQKDLLAAAAAKAEQRVAACLQAGDLDAAMARYREALAALPVLGRSVAARGLEASLQEAVLEAMRASSELGEAFALARAVRAAAFEPAEPLASLVEALLCAEGQRSGQELQPMMQLQQAASRAGAKALAAAAGACVLRDQVHRDQIAEARVRLAAGELDTARAMLTKVLEDDPLHDAARRDLDLVDRGMADLDQRLEGARSAARGGRLREACTVALTLVGGARLAKDAKALVADVRARMGLVDRGLDEVRVALHGRAAATAEGVRHCLRRLEELAKVQCDHEDLPKVTASVVAEIAALEACEKVDAALDRQAFGEGVTLLGSLLGMRAQLLAEDRLDARLLQLLDRVGQHAELALARGQLAAVDPVVELLSRSAGLRAEFALRSERLARTSAAQKESAAGLVATAEAQLQAGDLAEAERLCELAQQQWSEGAAARSLAERLADLRRQSDALARVENLTKERDFHGAHQKLAALPPTPALLRTRIFDMKQSLARAQGLEGAFLLRVDEGGEHLVLRGETVSIGNVRQTRSDLPLLANIAGRHASIRRSMSFHGGMQDTVVAEEGEVRVGGKLVQKHTLKSGDRIQLGSALWLGYQQPSTRSLSGGFVLQGGFQVAGTDRVLLMKDRGRDGRLLIGPGKDVHVRVPNATGEVEVFATNTGHMRVACDAGGKIDGVSFRGEHPIAAGQLVEAAGITFTLLPWRPGA